MGFDAFSALILGHYYDRIAMTVIAAIFDLSAFFVPFVFGNNLTLTVLGAILWRIGQGAIASILRSGICELVPAERRAFGFGVFSTCFGIMWFIGSVTAGMLYIVSIQLMIVVSMSVQFLAVALFEYVQRKGNQQLKIHLGSKSASSNNLAR